MFTPTPIPSISIEALQRSVRNFLLGHLKHAPCRSWPIERGEVDSIAWEIACETARSHDPARGSPTTLAHKICTSALSRARRRMWRRREKSGWDVDLDALLESLPESTASELEDRAPTAAESMISIARRMRHEKKARRDVRDLSPRFARMAELPKNEFLNVTTTCGWLYVFDAIGIKFAIAQEALLEVLGPDGVRQFDLRDFERWIGPGVESITWLVQHRLFSWGPGMSDLCATFTPGESKGFARLLRRWRRRGARLYGDDAPVLKSLAGVLAAGLCASMVTC